MLVQIHGGIEVFQHIGGGLIDGADMGHGHGLIGTPQFGVKLLSVQQISIDAHSHSPFVIYVKFA